MRVKLMLHYAGSFFIACLLIVVINVLYMRSYVYKEGELYNFNPAPLMSEISNGIETNQKGQLEIDQALEASLAKRGIGVQLLDENLVEALRFNVPVNLETVYNPVSLVALYENEGNTAFFEATEIHGKTYTVVMLLDSGVVKRNQYTYDVKQVGTAYNLYWLIGMNLLLLLMLSYIYTHSISRPIYRMIEGILNLSKGIYQNRMPEKGLYIPVDEAMNQLAKQLEIAHQDRDMADATREEWISNLSHDIKTPLTSIMGYGELIGDLDYPLTQDERVHYAQVLKDKGTYIKTLLADLNLATRLRHHPKTLKLESVNLIAEIKEGLIDVLDKSHVNYSKHTVAFTYTNEVVVTTVDCHLFKRVLLNLVQNSFSHNHEPVTVNVHVDDGDPEWIHLIVEDDGVGVKDEDLTRIFTRYYRGTSTLVQSEGSGLGLAIVSEIVQAHGGKITAQKSPQGGLRIDSAWLRS